MGTCRETVKFIIITAESPPPPNLFSPSPPTSCRALCLGSGKHKCLHDLCHVPLAMHSTQPIGLTVE